MTNQLTNTNLRKGLLIVTILIMVAVTIAARKPGPAAAEPVDLDGTSWTLVSIDGKAVLPGSEITAEFVEGQIGGSAGVNRYFAGYEAGDTSLTIGPAGSTMMMGPQELMEQEMSFLSALGAAESFKVNGDMLEIISGGSSLLFAAK